MDMQHLEGSIVALVTPFNDDGSVDFEALDRLIEFQIENGTDGILTLGTTGESSTMSHEEDNEVCRFVVERVGGRVPVIAGSGSNSTETMLEKSLAYQKLGVDGLLIITPYYNKANEEGIYRHLATVADGVDIPCILYNIPGRIAHLIGPEFRMFSGEDGIAVPLMSLGASGVISVWANVQPALVHEMCRAYLDGDTQRAREIQIAGQPLVHALFSEVNPIPVKEALAQMGLIKANYRLPLCPMSEGARSGLTKAMKEAGLLA